MQDAPGQRFRVSWIDLDARLMQIDYLRQTTHVAYNNGRSRRHRLQRHDPEWFVYAGEYCDVTYFEESVPHFVRHPPWEKYTILNSKLARFCTKAVNITPTGQHKLYTGPLTKHIRGRFHDCRQALLMDHAAHIINYRLVGSGIAGAKVR